MDARARACVVLDDVRSSSYECKRHFYSIRMGLLVIDRRSVL